MLSDAHLGSLLVGKMQQVETKGQRSLENHWVGHKGRLLSVWAEENSGVLGGSGMAWMTSWTIKKCQETPKLMSMSWYKRVSSPQCIKMCHLYTVIWRQPQLPNDPLVPKSPFLSHLDSDINNPTEDYVSELLYHLISTHTLNSLCCDSPFRAGKMMPKS